MSKYKDTLNLPKTDFPMKPVPGSEQARITKWGNRFVTQTQTDQGDTTILDELYGKATETFILHDGPPFANGDLHLGHALNKVIKDVISRYRQKLGDRVLFTPGWDCHGLPIENLVKTTTLFVAGNGSAKFSDTTSVAKSPEVIKRLCGETAQSWIDKQKAQFRSFGVEADWHNPYTTMQPEYEAKVVEIYKSLEAKGLIYRSLRPVHWSVEYHTALAEGELEYKTIKQQSVYVGLDLVQDFTRETEKLLIWTTTPWSLPGNVAVAVNPNINYDLVEFEPQDEDFDYGNLYPSRVWVAENLWKNLIPNGKVVDSKRGSELVGLEYYLPLQTIGSKTGKVVDATFVTDKAGTGLVHIAPAHGRDDYNLALEKNLKWQCPIKADATYNDSIESTTFKLPIKGKKVWDAEKDILNALKASGELLKVQEIEHEYPHDWRSGKPTITIATEQTFVALDKPYDNGPSLRKRAIQALDQVNFYPEFGKAKLVKMLSERPDWCVSRQRVWGINIPGQTDIFDVWFESGSSWSTLTQYPADLYIEGNDQFRGWFQHSLLLGVAIKGSAPFKTVVAHGFIVKPDGTQVHKKDKEYVKAVEIVDQVGVDALRLWIVSNDFQKDVTASPVLVKAFVEKYNKIRNTLKFLQSNLYDFTDEDFEKEAQKDCPPESLDAWMRFETSTLIANVHEYYENYEFHKVFQSIFNFCNVQVSSVYGNAMKDRLYCDIPDSVLRRRCQATLYGVYSLLGDVLEPLAPLLVDELAEYRKFADNWPWKEVKTSDTWPTLMDLRDDALLFLDTLKKTVGLNKAVDAQVHYKFPPELMEKFKNYGVDLEDLVGCGSYDIEVSEEPAVYVEDMRGTYHPNGKPVEACARCWKRRKDVGWDPEFPDLSARDVNAIVARKVAK